MKLKSGIFLCMAVYLSVVGVYVFWSMDREERNLMEEVDKHLFLAAKGLRHMLAEDFHDRAIDPDAISMPEEMLNRRRLSEFAFETNLQWVYTLARYQDRYYFSAPTVSEQEARDLESWYFYPYEDIPPEFVKTYEDGQTRYLSYEDQWGRFRSVVVAEKSPGGRVYLSCADYDISHVQGLLRKSLWRSLGVAAILLLASLPFALAFRAYSRRLEVLNTRLVDHKANLERTVLERTSDLVAARDFAERANRSKSEFLAVMSHEIRTPMNAMLGIIDILGEMDKDPGRRRHLKLLESSGNQLLAIANDILDISRIEAGRLKTVRERFDLGALINEVVSVCAANDACRGLELSASIDPDIPEYLEGDALRLRQVLMNLVGNSLKFTEEGRVEISVERAGAKVPEAGPHCVLFAVRDTGIGIPADKLDAVFNRFSQADSGISRNYGGSGLGLTISRRLVELMGGRIWCESEVGRGTSFMFILDLPVAEAQTAPARPESVADSETLAGNCVLEGKRILAAEDFDPNYVLLEMYLRKTPIVLSRAANGREAVDMFKQGGWDLVLMDVQMPLMGGNEAVRLIRQWEAGTGATRTPVLALTADALMEKGREDGELPYDEILIKPLKKDTLLGALIRHLGGRGGEGQALASTDQDSSGTGIAAARGRVDLENLMPVLAETVHKGLEEFTACLERGDAPEMERIAHGLKGAALSYGKDDLGAAFAALVSAVREGDMETAARDLRKTEDLVRGLFREEED